MALLIGDNFSYNGKKPNFERDSFETLAILKAFPEANIDNGHIAYCKETKKHYIFDDTNTIDETTGKWRELESEFINKVNISDLDNYVTDTELQEAISGVQFELPIATDSVLGGIKVGAGLNITEDGILSATGGGTADAVNWENVIGRPTNLSQFTNDSGFITSDDLPDLSNYATQSWVQEQGYLTSIPDNYITETELTEAINTVKYTLPIASTDVLGGIKVGAGLSINAETGVLSATGGGTADSVDWNNVLSKPDWITNTKPTYNYTEIEGDIPTSKLPIATTTSVGVIKIGSGLTIDGEGLLSSTISVISELDPVSEQPVRSSVIYEALNKKQDTLISGETLKTINGTSLLGSGNIVIESGGSGSGITDVLDNKTYARTQGSWVDLTDWLKWAEYD